MCSVRWFESPSNRSPLAILIRQTWPDSVQPFDSMPYGISCSSCFVWQWLRQTQVFRMAQAWWPIFHCHHSNWKPHCIPKSVWILFISVYSIQATSSWDFSLIPYNIPWKSRAGLFWKLASLSKKYHFNQLPGSWDGPRDFTAGKLLYLDHKSVKHDLMDPSVFWSCCPDH